MPKTDKRRAWKDNFEPTSESEKTAEVRREFQTGAEYLKTILGDDSSDRPNCAYVLLAKIQEFLELIVSNEDPQRQARRSVLMAYLNSMVLIVRTFSAEMRGSDTFIAAWSRFVSALGLAIQDVYLKRQQENLDLEPRAYQNELFVREVQYVLCGIRVWYTWSILSYTAADVPKKSRIKERRRAEAFDRLQKLSPCSLDTLMLNDECTADIEVVRESISLQRELLQVAKSRLQLGNAIDPDWHQLLDAMERVTISNGRAIYRGYWGHVAVALGWRNAKVTITKKSLMEFTNGIRKRLDQDSNGLTIYKLQRPSRRGGP